MVTQKIRRCCCLCGSLQPSFSMPLPPNLSQNPSVPLCFAFFWGQKKTIKLQDAFWRPCWALFAVFSVRAKSQNTVVFVPLAWKKYFLQHGENFVNTNVFARHWPKNTVTTMMFATRGKKKQGKYRGFGFPRHKEHRYLRVKKMSKHNLFDDFRPLRD